MSEVEAFYDDNAQYEWDRLDCHRTEFAVTMRALRDYLHPPPVRVLDIGGGPGRYAIALSKQRYQVTLFDLSRRCLEFAKQKAREAGVKLEDYRHGSATDLSFYLNESFDAILLMGPLYHLFSHEERSLTVKEAWRVLKENGLVFATFITRYAPFRWAAKNDPGWVDRHSELLETGIFLKDYVPSKANRGFTNAYFAHPSEIKPLMEEGDSRPWT